MIILVHILYHVAPVRIKWYDDMIIETGVLSPVSGDGFNIASK